MDYILTLGEDARWKNAEWGWKGPSASGIEASNYDNIDWRDSVIVKPTEQELIDAWPAIEQKYIIAVQDAQTAKTVLISNLRAGLVDLAALQDVIADILEGSL